MYHLSIIQQVTAPIHAAEGTNVIEEGTVILSLLGNRLGGLPRFRENRFGSRFPRSAPSDVVSVARRISETGYRGPATLIIGSVGRSQTSELRFLTVRGYAALFRIAFRQPGAMRSTLFREVLNPLR